MLALFWTSTIPMPNGRVVSHPIVVDAPDLESFCLRMIRDGGAMVTRIWTQRRDDGCAYITDEQPIFISLAGTASIRNADSPVRREVD